ncbi:hypothetical protein TSUD_153240 [Trifolium subterraneum]|uniref:NB-ARC domain-containing protein n=1 Tax=Trifolium subterraneum TaxID=3900 RepID=A0A2Z6MAB4_TRISU|nr:hypothetical protein TSUD_153240 [Trifolium subterraneum]
MFDPCATVLSCARETLLPILNEAVNMIRGVPNDKVAEMKNELQTIQEFIHQADKIADADEANSSDDGTREKIKQLIEASFHIQDIIDDYIIHEEQRLPDPGCVAGNNFVKTKFLRLQIAHNIHSINSRVNEMKDASFKKDNEGSSSSAIDPNDILLQNLRKAPFKMSEADVVGFEEPRQILIDWLLNGRDELTVVSVVATGGHGKTTLTKKVFDNIKGHFDYHVWITVSESYNIEELLRGLVKEICLQQSGNPPHIIYEMTNEPLAVIVDALRNYLQKKRYVLVFDDVCNSSFWDDIKSAMIDNQKGSRILITTRIMDVATSCSESAFVKIHELKGLDDEQSLKLFNKKAFHDLEEVCPENLIDISSKIVKKCGGVPLAIVVTGVEGFVKEEEGMTLEEVAEGYLTELIHRSLVQVVSINIEGRAKTCCVHDLVHDMILKKFEDLSFCKNIREDGQSALNGIVRRLSITTNSDNLMESIESSQVRLLLVPKPYTLHESIKKITTKYRLLKVFDAEFAEKFEVPKNLGSLNHLKYFSIGIMKGVLAGLTVLPKSIGMLENLETLDLTGSYWRNDIPTNSR